MSRGPFSAWWVRLECPCEARFDHAFRSPIFGAPLEPALWQVPQTASTTSLPPSSLTGAPVAETAAGDANAIRAAIPARPRSPESGETDGELAWKFMTV